MTWAPPTPIGVATTTATTGAGVATPPAIDVDRHRADVDELLAATLDARTSVLGGVSPELVPVVAALRAVADGGKRLRATFCLLGARAFDGAAVGGDVQVATALEVFHLAALVHDDLMDHSDLRRGRRTVHRRAADAHRDGGGRGAADEFGAAVAVLAGDLCLTWSDDLLAEGLRDVAPDRAAAVRRAWSRMRDETVAGQYLDVLAHTRDAVSVDEARRVLTYKSAKYTVEQPLLLGAHLAGAPAELCDDLSTIGLAVGEAFQLRDDVLGVFGDPVVTGKPAVDDVREGKRTLLVALAEDRATAPQREVLARHLGHPQVDEAGVAAVRQVLVGTGALDEVEERIATLATRALDLVGALAVTSAAREQLAGLIGLCAWRDV